EGITRGERQMSCQSHSSRPGAKTTSGLRPDFEQGLRALLKPCPSQNDSHFSSQPVISQLRKEQSHAETISNCDLAVSAVKCDGCAVAARCSEVVRQTEVAH